MHQNERDFVDHMTTAIYLLRFKHAFAAGQHCAFARKYAYAIESSCTRQRAIALNNALMGAANELEKYGT